MNYPKLLKAWKALGKQGKKGDLIFNPTKHRWVKPEMSRPAAEGFKRLESLMTPEKKGR